MMAGKTLEEIAGYDDYQISCVICLPRDKYGRLTQKQNDLPPWVHVDEHGMRIVKNPRPLVSMFCQAKRWQGSSPEEARKAWQEWVKENPGAVRGGIP